LNRVVWSVKIRLVPEPPEVLAPIDVIAYVLADLAIILIAARIVGQIFVWLKQPRIVGEIVAGILIGPTVLGGSLAKAPLPDVPAVDGSGLVNDLYPLQAFSFLSLIGQVGLVFYMFLVGIELNERLLKGRGAQIGTMAVAVVAVPLALGFVYAAIFDSATWQPEGVDYTTFALFVGAGLSVTAFPVMARILQEKGLLATQMGAVGVGSAAVVTVLMFLLIAAASASAKGSGIAEETGVKLLLTVVLILGLFLVARPLLALSLRYVPMERYQDTVVAITLIGALATGLAADRIGINSLVGGFLFGVAVPVDERLGEAIIERLSDMVILFFLPVFLAVSGLRTDFRLLDTDLIVGILVFLAFMILGKWGVGYLTGRAVGLQDHQAHTLGVLLNCRGLLILVVGIIGLQLGVITPELQVVFVIGAIVTTLMTGPLVDVFVSKEPVPVDADRRTSGVAILEADDRRRSSGVAVLER
jgi:Kef-type K+ transport system membrane component KefB